MADDGYALAGVALQIAGNPDDARQPWTRQVTEVPQGDLAAEGFWRLAWTAYLAGDTETAIRWAEQMVETVDYSADPVHVSGARYGRPGGASTPTSKTPAPSPPTRSASKRASTAS